MTVALREQVDEAAARRDLRSQIARLERSAQGIGGGGPRLLSLGELAATRDALVAARSAELAAAAERAEAEAAARCRLEALLADPARHRWQRVTRDELGEQGCGAYEVRPRLGLIGMLAGWWHVVVSSGCP